MCPLSRPKSLNARPILAMAAAATLLALAPLNSASAYTHEILHSFCSLANCADGEGANGGLLMDLSGNLYGTTQTGGKYGGGVVFKLVPNAKKTKYKEYILKNFCAKVNCADGYEPLGNLIMDVDGNLYGTTYSGGQYTSGEIYKLTHKTGGWTLSVIYSFNSRGKRPEPGLAYSGQASGELWDETSPLFGTTDYGGSNGVGVAYRFTFDGVLATYEIIHSFHTGGEHSAYPSPLLVDQSGILYGVTYYGGKYDYGALYKLAAGSWTETTLHNFASEQNGTDGSWGSGRLVMNAAGDLFGTTLGGGLVNSDSGVAFEYSTVFGYTLFYDFCSLASCSDGSVPSGGLTMDSAGHLYGTTFQGGGNSNSGVVFELASLEDESVLYTFCPQGGSCTDGTGPGGPLLLDGQGNLFGTTYSGGANALNGGTVFVLKP